MVKFFYEIETNVIKFYMIKNGHTHDVFEIISTVNSVETNIHQEISYLFYNTLKKIYGGITFNSNMFSMLCFMKNIKIKPITWEELATPNFIKI